MLPQTLVQNKIICAEQAGTLHIDWEKAAPVLNTNFFYIDELVKESQKYKKFLRFWEEVNQPTDNLKVHQYYTATQNNTDYGIHIGDWVGRVQNISNATLADCLVLTQSALYYIYDNHSKSLVLNEVSGVPCIIRPDLWGLTTSKKVSLNNKRMVLNGNQWQYNCTDDNLKFQMTYKQNESLTRKDVPLAFDTDIVMGRVLLDNDQLIAHVPVSISRKWNPQIIAYEFSLSFPDFNFPTTAKVEFW